LKNQNKMACRRAGTDDFTIHLITIMYMGGWQSLRIVQRYASVDTDHMHESIDGPY